MGYVSSNADTGYEVRPFSPLRNALVGSTVHGYDSEVASGHDDASPSHDDGNFYFANQDLSEDDDIGHIANASEESTNVSDSRLIPLHSNRTDQTEILSPQGPPKLPTIKEESPSHYEMARNVLVTRGGFPERKRSLSMTEFLEASNSKDIPTPPPKRLQCTVLQGPKPTPFTERPPTMIVTVNEILSSMGRLKPGHFLNDFIINAMAHRLESEEVGIVDSLTIASKTRTPRFRAKIQNTMSRNRVLIFVNHELHWLLYMWTGAGGLLQEYNSMPDPEGKFASCCATVTDFVRWAYGNPAMAVNLEMPACAEQQNGWDYGVYAIRFAECLATGQAVPDAIDGMLERKCLMNALLATWAGTLHSEEISAIRCPLTATPADKLRQFKNYYRRKRSFHQLLCASSSEYATSPTFTTDLRRMAASEDDAIQKSALASLIDSVHMVHLTSLKSALSAATEATTLLETSRQWNTVKNKMDDLFASLADLVPAGDLAALPAPDQSRYRNIEIIKNAGQNLEDNWNQCRGSGQCVEEAREQARTHFIFARVQLFILQYAVRKFRGHKTGNA
ncbi:hypothetical protein GCG54_00011660 [Colletotrichum gloeosporioides]|uniref:Ubiquitin-like protease family profile domain-containing protein n=1 Tax=Colletotrichum gloeosporioides TaxID=474922 RepID=A0A8H4FIU0_COLGL|nr:uncharacterized protein GCG54_00011660 [Colletotrichum gloeosporioides]KAF3803822.1 hypothetical protein GCG54_00011660 [Colletotrichum gloeosporioides]